MGYIISIEGIDAVGKHTQSRLLEAWLRNNGFHTVRLSFPDYRTTIGKEIKAFLSDKRRFVPELQHILFAANRWEKVPIINEYKNEHKIIIVNRYTESNIVYGAAKGLRIEWLKSLEEGIPKSDLVIVLDTAQLKPMSRRPKARDSNEKDVQLQLTAQQLYRKLASQFGWTIVDAHEGVESVHASVVKVVRKHMRMTGIGTT
ncbi:MAG: dTMP kinase [Nitrososphaerota archaeon]|jgi:dTMP kinase|nr:dTMP kinase [Nitrososphaerota archaeon]